jgi:O-antigen ligase
MEIVQTLKKDINLTIGFIEHHLGLSFIIIAFLSLFFQTFVKGKKIYLPGHFFLIYSVGCFFLSYSMWQKKESITIIGLELMLGLLGLYFYFQ